MRRFLMPRVLVSIYYFLRSRTLVSPRAEVEVHPNLQFGRACNVGSFAKIKASDGPVKVGAGSGFAVGCFVASGSGGIEIGEHFICGPNVTIVASNYVFDQIDVPLEEQGSRSRGIRIGRNVWIGANSTVVDGAVIGDNTIVVANSLINRRYPPNAILQGAPAKVLLRRKREQGE